MYHKRPQHPYKTALYNAHVTIEEEARKFIHALTTAEFWRGVKLWLLLGGGMLIIEMLFLSAMNGK